jgi:FkbM family methyltransferase
MADNLIFDVGAHKGEDTAFYLAKGYRVVAIEAHPTFCELLAKRFQGAVASGQLTILNTAISRKAGKIDFFINDDNSVWGTTNPEWVDRNRQLGASAVKKLVVDSCRLSDVVKRFGVPHYCKIDIEGNDVDALASFAESGTVPDFVSIESEKLDWHRLIKELRLFHSLGYRRFKVIDQSLIDLQECPSLDYKFEPESSGLFGEELPGRWLSIFETIEAYKAIFRGYALNGDCGFFPMNSRKGAFSAFSALTKLQSKFYQLGGWRSYVNPTYTLPSPGWYDTHAAK